MKKILVTGGAGYIGSSLLPVLLKKYKVLCVDKLDFGGESLLGVWHDPNFEFLRLDLMDFEGVEQLFKQHSFDAVIHLAAIVGDPACAIDSKHATQVNWDASKYLLDACIKAGVARFVFASTCSNYGKMSDSNTYVTEESALAPVSLYAELKVKFENYMLNEIPRSAGFSPTALRFSTVYGASPRMRFDLTVNEFTKQLVQAKELVIFGEQFWRSYCHVKDFAAAFIAVLEADSAKVAYEVFNVGDTDENYTKKMLVDEIKKYIPDAKVSYVQRTEDPRDYRVCSDKIKRVLGFEISMRVSDGIREVKEMLESRVIQDPENQRYYNIPHEVS